MLFDENAVLRDWSIDFKIDNMAKIRCVEKPCWQIATSSDNLDFKGIGYESDGG
jgi:hypothetical protein